MNILKKREMIYVDELPNILRNKEPEDFKIVSVTQDEQKILSEMFKGYIGFKLIIKESEKEYILLVKEEEQNYKLYDYNFCISNEIAEEKPNLPATIFKIKFN